MQNGFFQIQISGCFLGVRKDLSRRTAVSCHRLGKSIRTDYRFISENGKSNGVVFGVLGKEVGNELSHLKALDQSGFPRDVPDITKGFRQLEPGGRFQEKSKVVQGHGEREAPAGHQSDAVMPDLELYAVAPGSHFFNPVPLSRL